MSNICPQSRLWRHVTISKLFYFLYFIPLLTSLYQFLLFHNIRTHALYRKLLKPVFWIVCVCVGKVMTPIKWFVQRYIWWKYVLWRTSIRHREFFTLYHALKIDAITLQIMSLLNYINPIGGHLLRCRNLNLNNQGLRRAIANEKSRIATQLLIYLFWIFEDIKFTYLPTSFWVYRATQHVSPAWRKLSQGCDH